MRWLLWVAIAGCGPADPGQGCTALVAELAEPSPEAEQDCLHLVGALEREGIDLSGALACAQGAPCTTRDRRLLAVLRWAIRNRPPIAP